MAGRHGTQWTLRAKNPERTLTIWSVVCLLVCVLAFTGLVQILP
jgi:heme A synthase